jgi:hypothetical protein
MFTVKIIESIRLELSDDPENHYTGPDRDDVALEGVGCSVEDFIDCFRLTDEGSNFCTLVNSDNTIWGMSDIGGSRLELDAGNFITVSYDEWLDGYFKWQTIWHKNETYKLCAAAISRLDDLYNTALIELNLNVTGKGELV